MIEMIRPVFQRVFESCWLGLISIFIVEERA